MIPPFAKESLDNYAQRRVSTGGFLHAVLSNDLFDACAKADDINKPCLCDICSYIYNNLPIACWGSQEDVKAWLKR